MKNYLGVAVSIGVLAAVWTQVSVSLDLVTWVGFLAWACYFAAGTGRVGFTRGLAANLSGLAYGWLVAAFIGVASFPGALAIAVGVVAALMCLQAGWSTLSFIPGAFVGAAAYFGTAFSFWPTAIALVVGALLGWASGVLGTRLQVAVDGRTRTTEPPVAPAQAAA
ncbi:MULTISPECIES: DUF1097 domain-containing protein [unclassified Phycicoccus]|jgi:hypothetical protein|uniref:DUF1097 domain-containing protein n=1 Tax=unclassified Phycicoccus TaxID=2637926 RepID=UPI00070282AD|nr:MULTISPECIES: DUF1097 domain-containing protein [unclassified Phycicoccus]KQU68028.1 hypothetical protein ASC58_10545 [Phycicoccus sp. Root101]KQZ90035.1 hypothetical protein ASD62_12750 [Phycicoccus sp. Root563]